MRNREKIFKKKINKPNKKKITIRHFISIFHYTLSILAKNIHSTIKLYTIKVIINTLYYLSLSLSFPYIPKYAYSYHLSSETFQPEND